MQPECPWTKRETSIVHLLSLGMTAKEMSRETGTSPNTLTTAIQIIKLKAGLKGTTAGLVAKAMRNGWIK